MRPARHAGFSLIELLVTVGIATILFAIAVPSYRGYVIRSNRSDAQRLMTTIANRETQYLFDARAYTDTIGAGGLNITSLDGWTCEATCTNGRYVVAVVLDAGPPPTFTVTATALGDQIPDGALQLTSSGERTRAVGSVTKPW
jgi:type IV pilus assembly protein PilE